MGFLTEVLQAVIGNVVISTGSATINFTSNHSFVTGDTVSGQLDFGAGNLFVIGSETITKLTNTSVSLPLNLGLLSGTQTPSNRSYITKDEFYRDNYIAVDLVELHLKNSAGVSDPLYLCGGGFNIEYDSSTAPDAGTNVYVAQGNFIGIGSITEDFEIKVGKLSVTLSGVNNDYVNRFTAYSPEGQRVVILRAFLEFTVSNGIEQLTVVPDPMILFDGLIYNIGISETGSSCQINVDCASLFSDFDRISGRKTNNGSNWLFQDGNTHDTSMEQAGFVGQSNFLWGRL